MDEIALIRDTIKHAFDEGPFFCAKQEEVCAVTRGDRVATLEEANLHCQKSWSTCKAWATLDEGPLTPLSPLAAITNQRRFSVHLLCGVTRFRRGGATRFRRDRYL